MDGLTFTSDIKRCNCVPMNVHNYENEIATDEKKEGQVKTCKSRNLSS